MSDSKMSEGLRFALGLADAPPEKEPTDGVPSTDVTPFTQKALVIVPFIPKEVATSNADLQEDYVMSRNITHTLIDYAGNALQGALSVAISSQHPKAFEVFNQLTNTMRGLSKDLLEVQKTYQNIMDINDQRDRIQQNITQNNINITSSPEPSNNPGVTHTSMADKNSNKEVVIDNDEYFEDIE